MVPDRPRCPRIGGEKAACEGGCPARGCQVSGILNIDKPEAWTSHDVVARVRRLIQQRRVGHAGTLDPFATGVLLLCLGQATRVSEYLMEAPKLYRACVRFGASTDTYDITGAVTSTALAMPQSRDAIEALLPRFTGRILQTPPPYSAIKVQGERAYRRARRGEAVAPEARPVDIYNIEVRSWRPPDLEIDVLSGKGTYIRSLAHDLGVAAGSAAYLAALQRRAVGHFTIEDATPLAELESRVAEGTWKQLLFPLDEALLQYPALIVPATDTARLAHGQPIEAAAPVEGELRRVYGPQGNFFAVVRADEAAGVWRPHKVFVQSACDAPSQHEAPCG